MLNAQILIPDYIPIVEENDLSKQYSTCYMEDIHDKEIPVIPEEEDPFLKW